MVEFWFTEILRLTAAFGLIAAVTWLWYWFMDSVGTF